VTAKLLRDYDAHGAANLLSQIDYYLDSSLDETPELAQAAKEEALSCVMSGEMAALRRVRETLGADAVSGVEQAIR
jgi:hypothetical protein